MTSKVDEKNARRLFISRTTLQVCVHVWAPQACREMFCSQSHVVWQPEEGIAATSDTLSLLMLGETVRLGPLFIKIQSWGCIGLDVCFTCSSQRFYRKTQCLCLQLAGYYYNTELEQRLFFLSCWQKKHSKSVEVPAECFIRWHNLLCRGSVALCLMLNNPYSSACLANKHEKRSRIMLSGSSNQIKLPLEKTICGNTICAPCYLLFFFFTLQRQ